MQNMRRKETEGEAVGSIMGRIPTRRERKEKPEKPDEKIIDHVQCTFNGSGDGLRVARLFIDNNAKGDYGEDKFSIIFDGKKREFSNQQEILDKIGEYLATAPGQVNLVELLETKLGVLYSKFGVEEGFSFSEDEREVLRERASILTLKSDKEMYYGGLSGNSMTDNANAPWMALGMILFGVVGLATFGIGGFLLGGVIGAVGTAILLQGGLNGKKTHELKINNLTAIPHELFHGLSDNYRAENHDSRAGEAAAGINLENEIHLEEGTTSILMNGYDYKGEQKCIREYFESLPKDKLKHELNLIIRDYLNFTDTKEESEEVEKIKATMFENFRWG